MRRRTFFRTAVLGAGVATLGFSVSRAAMADPAQSGPSPYGPLLDADDNGLMLAEGFSSRVIARSSETVEGTEHVWHGAPDGGAVFVDGDGWIYVSNSELEDGAGGAGAVRFAADGTIESAYTILSGTHRNCAGGAMPWNTWVSCEEVDHGLSYEADPWGEKEAVSHPAMGAFTHEAAAADPVRKVVYQTEDEPDGCFYRFVPDTWGDLSAGTLQVLTETDGELGWADIPDPDGDPVRTADQVAEAKRFNGGEGCYYRNGFCYFTTKGDNTVWTYSAHTNRLFTRYDDDLTDDPQLMGVDNITGTPAGDLYVVEDGDNMEIAIITPDDVVAPFLRVVGHDDSELTGPAFSPAGDRLYFSSQRGTTGDSADGVTFEVTGPFRGFAR